MQADKTQPASVESLSRRIGLALLAVLIASILLRMIGLDQPIVENFAGRQVPTAMVARNLERGSGFLRPQVDTAPFPNYFMIEPPVYQLAVVAARRLTGLRLQRCGRIVSALATAPGSLGSLRPGSPP